MKKYIVNTSFPVKIPQVNQITLFAYLIYVDGPEYQEYLEMSQHPDSAKDQTSGYFTEVGYHEEDNIGPDFAGNDLETAYKYLLQAVAGVANPDLVICE